MTKARNRREPFLRFCCPDWRSDVPLRRCSYAARGLWIDMMTIMHESDPYGELRDAGQALGAADLVQLLGGSPAEIKKLLAELEGRGVFSRCEDGAIFSRRMKRDYAKAEIDRENGKGGGNPNLKRSSYNPPDNPNGGNRVNPQPNRPDKAHARAGAPVHFHFQKEDKDSGGREDTREPNRPALAVVTNLAKSLKTKPPPFTPSVTFQKAALGVPEAKPKVKPAYLTREQINASLRRKA